MRSIDVKGKRIRVRKAQYISLSCDFTFEIRVQKMRNIRFVGTYPKRFKALRVVDLDNSAWREVDLDNMDLQWSI